MKAILLISHGSKNKESRSEVIALASELKVKSQCSIVEYAFLDVEYPRIPEGVESCVKQGADQIKILLNFLNSGNHVQVDIPNILEEEEKKYTGVKFDLQGPIGQHPKLADLFLDQL
jgi:sirohydrochlorin ferrochelatase